MVAGAELVEVPGGVAEPGPGGTVSPARRVIGAPGDVPVRCPVCDTTLGAFRPLSGSRLTTRCPDRACRIHVVVVLVPETPDV